MDSYKFKKLPAATRLLLSQLNELFVEFVGPIGRDLADDVFAAWVEDGKINAAAIRHYVRALSNYLEVASEKQAFLQRAEKLLLQ